MICQPCRDAADAHLGPEHHCTTTGGPGAPCDCQHRTDQYRTAPKWDPISAPVDLVAKALELLTPDTTKG